MRFREIITEDYENVILAAVRDLLTRLMVRQVSEIETSRFQELLSLNGHDLDIPTIISVVDQSGFASSVNAQTITPKNQLPSDLQTGAQETGDEESPDILDQGADDALDAVKDTGL